MIKLLPALLFFYSKSRSFATDHFFLLLGYYVSILELVGISMFMVFKKHFLNLQPNFVKLFMMKPSHPIMSTYLLIIKIDCCRQSLFACLLILFKGPGTMKRVLFLAYFNKLIFLTEVGQFNFIHRLLYQTDCFLSQLTLINAKKIIIS